MQFYTNVSRYGNNILTRGYRNGIRFAEKIKYKPTLWVSTNKPTPWRSLEGKPVAPIQMDSMRDAKEWIKLNSDVAGRDIFGNTRYPYSYINEAYPGTIEFDRNLINVTTIDIEVASDDGFPYPELAER